MRPLMFFIAAMFAAAATADPGPSLPRLFARPQQPTKQVAPTKTQPAEVAPKTDGVAAEQPQGGAEVDTAEIVRRGDRVTRAGSGPMSSADQLLSEATAPPADDSGKWFVSIIVDDQPASQALLYDLRHSPSLRAWIDLDEPKGSWAHATVYKRGDQTQDWRWKNLKITALPCMILQPPAKLRDESKPDSWIWGDPKTVIWQFDGYDTTQAARADNRAAAIRKALSMYVDTMGRRQQYANVGPRQAREIPPPSPGARQSDVGASPPFPLSQVPQIPGGNPVFPADPTLPAATPTVQGAEAGIADLLGKLLGKTLGNPLMPLWVIVALKIFAIYAAWTPSKKDDAVAAVASSIVSGGSQAKPQGQ